MENMSISINKDNDFRDLSITFARTDIPKLKEMIGHMRLVKIMMSDSELILYRSIFKLVDIEVNNIDSGVLNYDYIFTIKDTLTDEDYSINMSYYDRVFFQNTNILN